MGTWGPALYSDDTAMDVRDQYRDLIGDDTVEPEATRKMLEEWAEGLADPDVAPVFWLALADTQWNLGRLQPRVRTEALAVIASGADLARWQRDAEAQFVAKRRLILERLRQKLESPQPPEKKARKRYVDATTWARGDVYSFRPRSRAFVLLRVIGFHQDHGGRAPVCEVLDWNGHEVPEASRLRRLGFRNTVGGSVRLSQFLFGSISAREYPADRLRLEARGTIPGQLLGGYGVILWRSADSQLDVLFGLK